MASYAKFLKEILTNKRKLEDHMTVNLTENCSALVQNKIPSKLKDPGSFSIPCMIGDVVFHKALCDLGASINLMPLSVFRKLGLGEPKPTRMSLQLADRSVKYPQGIIEDVLVKVEKFIFSADFVVLDMEEDMEMPLILGRPFLATGKALIDDAMKDPLEATLTTDLKENDLDEEKTEIVAYFDANHPWRKPMRMTLEDLGERRDLTPQKSSIEEAPTFELKPLPPHLKYVYLGESNTLLVIISAALTDVMEDKLLKVWKAPKSVFAWKVADIKGINTSVCMHKILMEDKYSPFVQPQRILNPKMQEVVKAETIKLLDAGYKQIMIALEDQDKTTFTCPYGTFAFSRMPFGGVDEMRGDKSSAELGKVSFYGTRRHSVGAQDITAWSRDVPFDFNSDCLQAYEDLKERLVTAPILVAPDWDLPFEVMCDASDTAVGAVLGQRQNKVFHTIYYAKIRDKKGVENVVADHLSRLELISTDCVVHAINDWFTDEQLFEVKHCPWYANFANFFVKGSPPPNLSFYQRKKLFSDVKHYFWEEPFLFKICADSMIRRCVAEEEFGKILNHCHDREVGGHFGPTKTASKVLECDFYWPTLFKDARSYVLACDECQRTGNISNRHEMPLNNIIGCEVFDVWGIDFMGPFTSSFTKKYILVAVDYVSKWVEAEAYATNDAQVVFKFLKKNIFNRFVTPRAIISDELEHRTYWATKALNFDFTDAGERRLLQVDQLEEFRNLAYDLALSYKKKTKRAHDKQIIEREFKVSENVLLNNSRLRMFPGKLKS
ncbi:uncharacterized protein [Primulina huaijiensis]|uniref:uncharacterized protein n=1 Tax=Primulina huaijiensis TaxID=1492673 RepID=UPI003CC728C0